MDPDQIKNAAAAMANMSPEQRQQMQSMFANMDPNMIANLSRSMGMPSSAAQIAEAQKKMGSGEVKLDDAINQAQQAADNPAMLNAMKQQQASQTNYMLTGAKSLKEKGNTFFKAKNFAEAADCYRKAATNLSEVGADTSEAHDLMKACRLNLAMCCLQTTGTKENEALHEAERECTSVIATHPADLKARYRRGVARERLGNFRGALVDLKAAAKQAPSDDSVSAAVTRIQAKVDDLPEEKIEEVDDDAPAENDTVVSSAAPSMGSSGGSMPGVPPGMGNPEQMKMAADMMSKMSPEETAAMMKTASAAMSGNGGSMPGMPPGMGNPEQMKMAADMMSKMTPEQTESMMKMASKMGPMMGAGSTGGAGPAKPDAEAMAKMTEEMTKNPEMMKSMTDMMKDMDPEVLAKMSEQSGMPMTKEQAEQVTNQMKNISPETMQKVMVWSNRVQWAYGYVKVLYDKMFGTRINAAISVAVISYFLGSYLWS